MRRWVAKLRCDHVIGNQTSVWPAPEDYALCPVCDAPRLVEDVVTDEPLTGPDGKR